MDENNFWLNTQRTLVYGIVGLILGSLFLYPGCKLAEAEKYERCAKAVQATAPSLDPAAQVLLVDRTFPYSGPR